MTMPFDATRSGPLGAAPDEALLLLYAAGDVEAARELTARHLPAVLRLASRMLGEASEAEDVAQETMLRLWRIAPEWRAGQAKLSTWVYRVAANLATDRLRRRRGGVGLDQVAEPADERPSADERLIAADRARALQAALDRLPDRQRLAVVLRHLEGQSNPEIAAVMEISVEAVESLLSRGRRALAQDLATQRNELGLEQ